MNIFNRVLLVIAMSWFCYAVTIEEKPVLYIVGDSTVKNGSGRGGNELWGWGSFIAGYVDTTRLGVENQALGGRSSRTFITEGHWAKVSARLKKGDFVIMQFGHNDGGPLDDTARARGTIKGIGMDSVKTYNPIRKVDEMVYSYGEYLRRMVRDAREKGATVLICSPIPRNDFKDGKVKRDNNGYARWARQVAEQNGAFFIDLNARVADRYDVLGAQQVARFFPKDHTHTNEEGARLNAGIVVEGIREATVPGLVSFLQK